MTTQASTLDVTGGSGSAPPPPVISSRANDDLREVLLTLTPAQFETFATDLAALRAGGADSNTEAVIVAVREIVHHGANHKATLEPWLDRDELAGHFGCSARWIRYRQAEGMPHAMIAGRCKFRPSEVELWLQESGRLDRRGGGVGRANTEDVQRRHDGKGEPLMAPEGPIEPTEGSTPPFDGADSLSNVLAESWVLFEQLAELHSRAAVERMIVELSQQDLRRIVLERVCRRVLEDRGPGEFARWQEAGR